MSSSNPYPPAALHGASGHAANAIGHNFTALWRFAGNLVAVWLALSGALLVARSAMQATTPLRWQQILFITVGLVAVAWFSHAAAASQQSRRHGVRRALFGAVFTSIGLLLWGIALSRGTGSYLTAAAIFLPLIAEETWTWRKIVSGTRPEHRAARPVGSGQRIVQQFTRSVAADGVETIHGSVAIGIERDSRTGAAHVAFCPPFIERPLFDAHLSKPNGGTVKVTHLYAHGARIEVRLPRTAESELRFLVRFQARSQSLTNSSVAHRLGSSR